MAQLTDLVDGILRATRFDAGSYGRLTAAQMRSLDTPGRSDQTVHAGAHCKRHRAGDRTAVLVKELGRELQAFMEPETQRIGTGLVDLMGGARDRAEPTVTEFARTFVRAAAIIGSARAVEILRGWVAGEPYRYCMKILLTGVQCEQPLALEQGVRVKPLPTAGPWGDLVPLLPETLGAGGFDVIEYLGRPVLSIDGTPAPPCTGRRYPWRTAGQESRAGLGRGSDPLLDHRHMARPIHGGVVPCERPLR